MLRKIMIFAVLLMIPLGYADTVTSCLDSDTLQQNTTKVLVIDGNTTTFNVYQNITCEYGCDNSQCQEATLMTTGFMALFGVFSLALIYLSSLTGNKIFGLVGGMVMLVMGIYTMAEGIMVSGLLLDETVTRIIGAVIMLFSVFLMYSFITQTWGDEEYE